MSTYILLAILAVLIVAAIYKIDKLLAESSAREFDLKRACDLKGVPFSTFQGRPSSWPNGGEGDWYYGSRPMWHLATVLAWVPQPPQRRGR